MRKWFEIMGVTLLLFALSATYLYPGAPALMRGDAHVVMGDDTDISGMPYIYDQVTQVWKTHPSWLLFGSVHLSNLDPAGGNNYWMPFVERILTVAFNSLVPVEQMSTAISLSLIVLSGLSMFALARYQRWSLPLALALGIAWAITPFSRARAKVHVAMAGVYHIPLIVLALLLIARGRHWRSLLAAALALLFASMAPHYFVVTSLFLTPLFLIFLFLQPESRSDWKRVCKRLALASVPMVLFLTFSLAFPQPPSVNTESRQVFPKTGETSDGSIHPFLTMFAAKPIDFLAGDLSLAQGARDLNPLREVVNQSILNNLGDSNPHERTNGIRWVVLALALLAFASGLRSSEKRAYGFWLCFGLFTFWLSLSPDTPFAGVGPSGWLYRLVSQVRVPSRAGILVHFALLMAVGTWLNTRVTRHRFLMWALPLIMVLDYPPFVQDMPMMTLRPAYTELARDKGQCGYGMYFPFVTHYHLNVLMYHFMQQARGTDCGLLNGIQEFSFVAPLAERFPPTMEFLTTLDRNLVVGDQLRRLADCVPLSFIAFDEHVPKPWREQTCASLGWQMNPDLTCVSPRKGLPLARLPHACL